MRRALLLRVLVTLVMFAIGCGLQDMETEINTANDYSNASLVVNEATDEHVELDRPSDIIFTPAPAFISFSSLEDFLDAHRGVRLGDDVYLISASFAEIA